MRNTHVELIDPKEKLSPSLGGTGYVAPKEPSSVLDLYANAAWAAETYPELNMTVWKVSRASVNWKRHANQRRLRIDGRSVPCEVIGGTHDWWFVSVDATQAAKILKP